MSFRIAAISAEHIPGFRSAVDSVARELLYLAMTGAPPPNAVRKFVMDNIARHTPQFVAVADDEVVGWCDVIPKPRPSQQHSGVLGMGVIASYRRRGIGRSLMDAALKAARETGMTRVELTVRVNNEPARKLYESFGFVTEGVCRRHVRINGAYDDSYYMAVLF
jgi:ribosomal protein S18 acetylase RimI-like enzyme